MVESDIISCASCLPPRISCHLDGHGRSNDPGPSGLYPSCSPWLGGLQDATSAHTLPLHESLIFSTDRHTLQVLPFQGGFVDRVLPCITKPKTRASSTSSQSFELWLAFFQAVVTQVGLTALSSLCTVFR